MGTASTVWGWISAWTTGAAFSTTGAVGAVPSGWASGAWIIPIPAAMAA